MESLPASGYCRPPAMLCKAMRAGRQLQAGNHPPPRTNFKESVGYSGVEPDTSYLSGKRSTDELIAHLVRGFLPMNYMRI